MRAIKWWCSVAGQQAAPLQPSTGPSRTTTLPSARANQRWRPTTTARSPTVAISPSELCQGGADTWTVWSTEEWQERGRSECIFHSAWRKTQWMKVYESLLQLLLSVHCVWNYIYIYIFIYIYICMYVCKIPNPTHTHQNIESHKGMLRLQFQYETFSHHPPSKRTH